MSTTFRRRVLTRVLGLTAIVSLIAGCANPLAESDEARLHEQLLAAHRRELAAVAGSPTIKLTTPTDLVGQGMSSAKKSQLDRTSGMQAYLHEPLEFGKDLTGNMHPKTVTLSLEQAVTLAVQNNLELQGDGLVPGIAQTQMTQAAAKFDATFFTNVDYKTLDTPRPPGTVPGLTGDQATKEFQLTTGIRKKLTTGGKVTVQTDITRHEMNPTYFLVDHYYDSDILASLTQPLLRGFGSDVNRARIELAHNNQRSAVAKLKTKLIDKVAKVEQAYWVLQLAETRLRVYQELVKRTQDDRKRLLGRKNFDVTPVQTTQVDSYLETNRTNMFRSRKQLRLASDKLKRLVNDPKLPESSETLILTSSQPADTPIKFNLLDAVTTALRHRPELQTALLTIKDASIRQRVADNALLPVLNITATVRYNGLDTNAPVAAFSNNFKGNFIDYLLRGQFEVPIGNRGPEAQYHQTILERQKTVFDYQAEAQTVVGDVKDALHNLQNDYTVIASARDARRAAADHLRALNVQEKAGAALTPAFLIDLKLNAEQQLATAEVSEAEAVISYNNDVTVFFQATGTLLNHDRIEFENPDTQPSGN